MKMSNELFLFRPVLNACLKSDLYFEPCKLVAFCFCSSFGQMELSRQFDFA